MGTAVEIRELHNIPVLSVAGTIDHSCSAAIKNALGACVDQGKIRIVVDLGAADSICYVGLGILVACLNMVRAMSGDIRLAGLHAALGEAFGRTGVSAVFALYPTAEDAAISFLRRDAGMQNAATRAASR